MRRPVVALAAAVVVLVVFVLVVFVLPGDVEEATSPTAPTEVTVAGTAAELVCAGQACLEADGSVGTVSTSGIVDLSEAGVVSPVESVSVAPLAGQDASALVEVEGGKVVDMRALPPGPYLLTVVASGGVYQFNVELGPDAAG